MNLKFTESKTTKMYLVSVVMLCLSLILASCATSPTQPSSSITVSPTSRDVKAGDVFTFNVLIDTEIASRGAQCTLTFDPTLVKCDRITEGNFYKDWAEANSCSTILIPEPVIDNVNGKVSNIGIAIMGTKKGGVKGSGVLLTYHFSAIANGVVAPILSNMLISDESGNTSHLP